MEIIVRNGDIEKALKMLKKKIQKEGLLGEIKKRRYYDKPSVKMRKKRIEAAKRRAKSARKKTPSYRR